MPQQTKIFRVFVSSTFTDMKQERYLLQKDVFPKLERYCEERGAKFQAVDLRWGVSEESTLNQKTLDICLNEIARCQRLSPKPNFLILLGDKYGWQPLPSHIPSDEMQKIKEVANNLTFIDKWYKEDLNAIPPEFVLQPRGETYKKYDDWEPLETELRNVLRNAAIELEFKEEQKIKYFASATHQEILAGALHKNNELEKPEEHVFCFNRQVNNYQKDDKVSKFRDYIDEEVDEGCQKQLTKLKSDLKTKLDEHFINYKADWKDGETKIVNRKTEFTEKVEGLLWGIIEKQLKQAVSKDEIEHEVGFHEQFKNQLVEHFKGRVEILTNISNYLNNKSEQNPLALIGESGSGKSSVMAKAVQDEGNKGNNSVIIYRFIGASSASTNLVSLLQSVASQIAGKYNTTLEELAGEGYEKNLHEIYGITEVFKKSLELSTPEKPLIVFLDALDQLTTTETENNFYWFPNEIPENSSVVVSALKELEHVFERCSKINLPKLPAREAEEILDAWFKVIKRTLTDEQEKLVLHNKSTEILPIYLKLAFEQAKKWESYKTNISLKHDVPGIINDFIDSLATEHNREFVQDVICLMLCGRYKGLSENEILEIFAFDDGLWQKILAMSHKEHRQELTDMKKQLGNSMKMPIALWSRLFLDLEPFLTERDADGVPIITFFHRQFNEVLAKRYNLSEETKAD